MKFLKNSAFFCSLILLLSLTNKVVGQSFLKVNQKNISSQYQSLSLGVGTSHYYGDLSPYKTFYYGLYTNVRWNASLNYTHYLTPNWGLRFGFTWARIAGDDFTYSQRSLSKFYLEYFRNLSFRNDVKEFTVEGIFNLIAADTKNVRGRDKVVPYAFIGLGLIGHSPQAKLPVGISSSSGKSWVSLSDLYTAGQGQGNQYPQQYSSVAMVIPLGLGVRYKINEKFDFSAELGFRYTSTDYLDDVGHDKYVNPLTDIPTVNGQLLSKRGGEEFAAVSGKSRIQQYQWIFDNVIGSTLIGAEVPSSGGYKSYISDYRGNSNRVDSYLLTTFSLHYVISNDVKCPPIR